MPAPAEFVVRPCLDGSGRPLIEFRGDHRTGAYPQVLPALERGLPGFEATLQVPAPEDFVWQCRFDGGEFELCDDWNGLFILPKDDAGRVIETVAEALEKAAVFRRLEPDRA